MPTLLCPSDGNASNPGMINGIARNNVVACVGDYLALNHNPGATETTVIGGTSRAAFSRTFDSTTTFSGHHPSDPAASPRWHFTPKGFGSITDGLSNSMGLSEAVTASDAGKSTNPKEFVVHFGFNNTASPPYSRPPADCRDRALGAGGRLDQAAVDATMTNTFRGHVWVQGMVGRVGFVAALPPNSPSCTNRNNNPGTDLALGNFTGWGAYSATSYHSGGVNTAMLDGSVRFVSDAVNCPNLDKTVLGAGTSPYGVWGALGTINGGESVSL